MEIILLANSCSSVVFLIVIQEQGTFRPVEIRQLDLAGVLVVADPPREEVLREGAAQVVGQAEVVMEAGGIRMAKVQSFFSICQLTKIFGTYNI